ncbi:MAG: hypothetical protein CMD18_00710 [Flavobacteriales bacterium]|nr:hypothetical protein [Flavobacteriales bacterium]
MKFLKRSQIEDDKWNECILKSTNGLVYGLTWFLDELTSNWSGFVVEKKGLYESVFPVPLRRKFGVRYVYPPFFIQQLGLFALKYSHQEERIAISLMKDKFKFIELNLNYKSEEGESKTNLVLKLAVDYSTIQRSYSKNHLRNLKKADKLGLKLENEVLPEHIISLFKSDRGLSLETYSSFDYQNLLNLCSKARDENALFTIGVTLNSMLICGGVFMKFKNRIIFLFSGNSKKGKDVGALFLLLDAVIKMYANSGFVLDLEGSQNEGLNRFYSGFGALEENYRFLKINNLPNVLKRFKK